MKSDKTECIPTSTLKDTTKKLFCVKINTESLRCLGIYSANNKKKYYRKNWIDKNVKTWKNVLKQGEK